MLRAIGITILTATLSTLPAPSRSEDTGRFLLTEREALLLVPPEVVASWDVREAEWFPDGAYVLASRMYQKVPPVPKGLADSRQSLVLWDTEERKSTELWKAATNSDRAAQFAWLATDNVAFAVIHYASAPVEGAPPKPPREWLVRIHARKPSLRTISEVPGGTRLLISREPLAVLFHRPTRTLRVVRADGSVSRQAAVPAGVPAEDPGMRRDGLLNVP